MHIKSMVVIRCIRLRNPRKRVYKIHLKNSLKSMSTAAAQLYAMPRKRATLYLPYLMITSTIVADKRYSTKCNSTHWFFLMLDYFCNRVCIWRSLVRNQLTTMPQRGLFHSVKRSRSARATGYSFQPNEHTQLADCIHSTRWKLLCWAKAMTTSDNGTRQWQAKISLVEQTLSEIHKRLSGRSL